MDIIEHKTFINGKLASEVSDEMIFELIRQCEERAADLYGIRTASKKVQREIDRLYAQAKSLVAFVDNR